MSDSTEREASDTAANEQRDADAVPGEAPADPAYAAGAGFSGEATAATPPDPAPEAAGETERPAGGGSAGVETPGPIASVGSGADDLRTMAMIAHILNIVGVFTGGFGNLVALVLAWVKKDAAPDWIRTHFVLAIRTVLIGIIACVALVVLGFIAIPLSLAGVGLVMFPLIGIAYLALCAWTVARSVVGLMRLNDNRAYDKPETWLV